MTDKANEPDDEALRPTWKVLHYLSECKPFSKVVKTSIEVIAQKVANQCLGFAFLFLASSIVFAYFNNHEEKLTPVLRDLGVSLAYAAIILSIASMLAPIIASCISLIRWEKLSFQTFDAEIRHDFKNVTGLRQFEKTALEDAKAWIEVKISRLEAKVGYFFGEKTAAFAMLAISYSCVKALGGREWLTQTFSAGFSQGNILNTLSLYGIAFILGISIGSMLLRRIAMHYRYQKDLLEFALRKKSDSKK
ncbi:hypothetical protein JQR88_00665 [Pseudomonas luteola]|uniref:hypothetical protein n=1 Tax=Pseudomonas luteola TaxID=47886 RepID=UPI003DA13FC1